MEFVGILLFHDLERKLVGAHCGVATTLDH